MYSTEVGEITGVENPLIPNVVGADDVNTPLIFNELLVNTEHDPLKSLRVLQVRPPLLITKYVGIEICKYPGAKSNG